MRRVDLPPLTTFGQKLVWVLGALALELYGTWLGNWTWAVDVPRLDLVTTNPPGAAGAFYCALDALVAAASLQLAPRWRAWTIRSKADGLAL